MKKLFQDAFFRECVIKLGSVYVLLVVLGFIFLEYRSSQSMTWANGFVFATHDKISFAIFILILITFFMVFILGLRHFFDLCLWFRYQFE